MPPVKTADRTLIVKLGAPGDVVRTTVLLGELDGEIHWLSRKYSADLLGSGRIARRFFLENDHDTRELEKVEYGAIVCLEEDPDVLALIRKLTKRKWIGAFLDDAGRIDYTDDSRDWYDMSLISRLGKEEADEIKKRNRSCVQEIYLRMIGKDFHGQEYDIGVAGRDATGIVGLIDVSSGLWPNKHWHGYRELGAWLREEGYEVRSLGMRATLREHIDEINGCELVVCGDTLGMHIALALRKQVIALFNCTSPHEIFDYGRMVKIVSPLCGEAFYKKEATPEVIRSIPVREVFDAVTARMKAGRRVRPSTRRPR